MKRKEETLMGWNIIWWLFKLFGFPITIPWLVYHFYDIMQQKRRKTALSNKVTSCEVFQNYCYKNKITKYHSKYFNI